MLEIVFDVFPMMFAKTSLLFCCFCIRLFVTNYVCVVPCGFMRNLDAIIRVRMVLCEGERVTNLRTSAREATSHRAFFILFYFFACAVFVRRPNQLNAWKRLEANDLKK